MSFIMRDLPMQVEPAVLEKCLRLETATMGHRRHMGFVDRRVQGILPDRRIAGTAVTLALPGQDSTLLHHIIQFLRSGDVLVIDRLGDDKHACVGGGVAVAVKATGCAGVVVDGPCTDFPEITQYDLPVWCRGPSPITTRLHGVGGSFNAPICCGGAVVNPGDIVIADHSGVLNLPPRGAEPDIDWALEKQAREPEIHKRLMAGERLGERSGASRIVMQKTDNE